MCSLVLSPGHPPNSARTHKHTQARTHTTTNAQNTTVWYGGMHTLYSHSLVARVIGMARMALSQISLTNARSKLPGMELTIHSTKGGDTRERICHNAMYKGGRRRKTERKNGGACSVAAAAKQ